MANPDHVRLVKKGTRDLNFFKRFICEPLDLEGAQLQEVRLAGANLARAKLRSAKLTDADLHGTQFERADMRGVDLRDAKLRRASLNKANLSDALVTGADMKLTQLNGAELRGAQLSNTTLEGAQLQEADVRGAKLREVVLKGAKLEGAELVGAQLEEVDLSHANLKKAKLEDANLIRVTLDGAHLEEANLHSAHIERSNLVEARFEGANLRETTFVNVLLSVSHFENADMFRAHLDEAIMYDTHFEGASLCEAHLIGAHLHEAHFEDADLFACHLDRADLRRIRISSWFRHWLGTVVNRAPQFTLDETHIEKTIFDPASYDKWNILTRKYTGARFVFILFVVVLALTPYFLNAMFWVGANRVEEATTERMAKAISKATELVANSPSPKIREWSQHARMRLNESAGAPLPDRVTELVQVSVRGLDLLNEELAKIETKEKNITELDKNLKHAQQWTQRANLILAEFEPDVEDKFPKYRVWQLVLGIDKGIGTTALIIVLILYNVFRGKLTLDVGVLRDRVDKCGVSPAKEEYDNWRIWGLHRVNSVIVVIAWVSFLYNVSQLLFLPVYRFG